MSLQEAGTPTRCAWCDHGLPAARVVLSVVYGTGAPVMETCSMTCLTQLVAMLARKATRRHQTVGVTV